MVFDKHRVILLIVTALGVALTGQAQDTQPAAKPCYTETALSCCLAETEWATAPDGTSYAIRIIQCGEHFACHEAPPGTGARPVPHDCLVTWIENVCLPQLDGTYRCERVVHETEAHAGCRAAGDPCAAEVMTKP